METSSTLAAVTAAKSFVVWCRCLVAAKGSLSEAREMLTDELGSRSSFVQTVTKATVPIMGDTTNPDLAHTVLAQSFMEQRRRVSVLGRIAGGMVPLPPRGRVAVVTNLGTPAWVGTGQPVPLAQMAIDRVSSEPTKLMGMLAVAEEQAQFGGPESTSLVERMLLIALGDLEESSLFDSVAASSLVRPAGLLWNVSASGAGSPSDIPDDLNLLWSEVRDGESHDPRFVTDGKGAWYLSTLSTSGGARLFPDINPVTGGTINGVPVVISRSVAGKLVLLDASAIGLWDGGLRIDYSGEAAVQMVDNPSGAAELVSGFQTNTAFLRLTRPLFWAKGYADAVGYITLPSGSPA